MKNHLNAFTVSETNKGNFWTRIGTAFQNRNGGFTLVLTAMPAAAEGSYRIILQVPKEEPLSAAITDLDRFDVPQMSQGSLGLT